MKLTALTIILIAVTLPTSLPAADHSGQTNPPITAANIQLATNSRPLNFYIEAQRLSIPGGSQLQALLDYNITDTFGLYAFGQKFEHAGQLYAGPTFSPAAWLKLGTGLGVEEADRELYLRSGSFLWLGREKNSLLAIGEYSEFSHWWHVEANHDFTDWFGAGLFAQADAGIGPRLQFTLPNKRLMFWLAPTYYWETKKPRLVGGIRYNF